MLLRALLLTCFVILGSGDTTLSATVLYSQPWDGLNNAFNSQDFGSGNATSVFDNFVLASGGSISGISWWGLYSCNPPSSCSPPSSNTITDFTVAIYGDAGGTPGSVLQSWSVLGNAGETPVASVDGYEVYLYSASVNFVAAPGTQYWLLIRADLLWPPSWGWMEGSGGDSISYVDSYGTWSENPNDLAFMLESTPEPFTLCFLGIGLSALALWRRRHAPEPVAPH